MLPSFDQEDAPPATLAERVDDALLRLDAAREQPAAIAGAVFTAFVLVSLAWWISRPSEELLVEDLIPEVTLGVASPTTSDGGQLTVHVTGAVAFEGVFFLAPGARVIDAIEAAGGASPDADLHRLNLAAELRDGTQIRIPIVGEGLQRTQPTIGQGESTGADGSNLININVASESELEQLPGVGPATASAIVRYREEHGMFTVVEDLLGVAGIGPAKLAGLIERASLG